MIKTISVVNSLLPFLCLVNHIRTNSVNYEKLNATCENFAEENTTATNLYFNKPTDSSCDEDDNASDTVTIGFLGAYGQAQVLLGALPLAVEAVNNDESKYV